MLFTRLLQAAAGGRVMGAEIKSIQYGIINLNEAVTSDTAVITEVDTNKSVVFSLGCCGNSAGNQGKYSSLRVVLSNSTTVTAYRYAGETGSLSHVRFCVIEFESGIVGVQSGSISIPKFTYSVDFTITEVNVDKTMILPCGHSTGDTIWTNFTTGLLLVNSTTVRAQKLSTGEPTITQFSLIEFS